MNRRHVIPGILALILMAGTYAGGQSSLTNGLVAYYPFSGNANDGSGNANDGTPVGAVLAADRFNQPNKAYALDGDGDHIFATNRSYLTFPDGGDFTVSIWAAADGDPSTNPSRQWYLCGLDNGPGYASKWFIYYGLQGWSSWPENMKMVGFHTIANGDQSYFLASSPWEPVLGTWHHYVFTKAGTTYAVYIDGTQRAATNWVGTPPMVPYVPVKDGPAAISSGITARLTIGWAEEAGYFKGKLDDLRIYNRPLSTAEVGQLYEMESKNCGPYGATAVAQVVNGFMVGVTVTDGGCGYTEAPYVMIAGGGGTGAAAEATVVNGVITGIKVTNAGVGYTNAPVVRIASPPFAAWLDMSVSRVKVTQHVVLGKKYRLESSLDLNSWTTLKEFTAESEAVTNEFEVDVTGRYFRIRQLP